jgi:cell surface protein SprA
MVASHRCPAARNSTAVTSILTAFGLQPCRILKKRLQENFSQQIIILIPQIGFISLNQQLQPDEVLAVAFEYTVQRQVA